MRPAILNPIFAEMEALKGVGPQLAKPLKKLGLVRTVDALFHLPTGSIVRRQVPALHLSDVGSAVIVELKAVDYRQGGRGPFRVEALDREGNSVSLVYFGGQPGWARKLLM